MPLNQNEKKGRDSHGDVYDVCKDMPINNPMKFASVAELEEALRPYCIEACRNQEDLYALRDHPRD